MSWMGELTGSSTTTTIRLWGLVGVWLVWVMGLPFGLEGLILGEAASVGRDVVWGAGDKTSMIYFIISISA
jgi:hypothetical protein